MATVMKRGERLDYLDGLRGWAALSVVIYHATWEMFGRTLTSFQTTWLGPLNDGQLAVSIFFVLSGVVLTASTSGEGNRSRLKRTAAGRYFRLTIPVLASTFIGYAMMSLGLLYNKDTEFLLPGNTWLWQAMSEQVPLLSSWLTTSSLGLYRWGFTRYNPFLWTMPIELFGSFFLFGTIALFGDRRVVRLGAFSVGVAVASLLSPKYATFFCGALLFDLATLSRTYLGRNMTNLAGALLMSAAVCISIFFRGQNDTVAATTMVGGLLLNGWLQTAMRTAVSQWLGRVSFPLYLVHCYVIYGPACWGVIQLHAVGFGISTIALIVSPLTVLASLVMARIFSPIEAVAIIFARAAGSFLTQPSLPAFAIRKAVTPKDEMLASEPRPDRNIP